MSKRKFENENVNNKKIKLKNDDIFGMYKDINHDILKQLSIVDIKKLFYINKETKNIVENYCKKQFYWKKDAKKLYDVTDVNQIKNDTTHVRFRWNFDKEIDLTNFNNLIYIYFGNVFDQNVDNLPSNLQKLEFGYEFNQNIDNLPPNLHTLKFSKWFNQKVDNLPTKLKTLILPDMFNQNLDKLPKTLEELCVGWRYKCTLDNLPPTLKKLVIDKHPSRRAGIFFEKIRKLPQKLEELHIRKGVLDFLKNVDLSKIKVVLY